MPGTVRAFPFTPKFSRGALAAPLVLPWPDRNPNRLLPNAEPVDLSPFLRL